MQLVVQATVNLLVDVTLVFGCSQSGFPLHAVVIVVVDIHVA